MKLRNLYTLLIIFFVLFCPPSISVSAASGTLPVNPNASSEAKSLLQTMYNMKGRGMITGVYNWHAVPRERTEKLKNITGEYAGIWNCEFGYGDTSENMQRVRREVINTAKAQAEAGNIISLMWHEVKPSDAEADGWNSVQGYYINAEYDKLLTDGTELHSRWLERIDETAEYLKQLRDAKIPVLWRPYHEPNLACFWWGKNGGERYIELWRQMYDRYTNYHGLNNLIWCWSAGMGDAAEMYDYFPGNAYVDVIGIDIYQNDGRYNQGYYDALVKIANGKPIGISECGNLPDIEYIKQYQPDYCYFIEWADYIDSQPKETIASVYNNPYCCNLGEIPDNLTEKDGPGLLPDYPRFEFYEVYASDITHDSVTLRWKDFEPDAVGYKIILNEEVAADIVRQPEIGGSAAIDGLKPNTEYRFTIQPYGNASTGWLWLQNTRSVTVTTRHLHRIIEFGNGEIYMDVGYDGSLDDYTVIVASYENGCMQSVEMLKPAPFIRYKVVDDCDETKVFVWKMNTLKPL